MLPGIFAIVAFPKEHHKAFIVQSFELWASPPQGNTPMSHHSGYPLRELKRVDDYRCYQIKVNERDYLNGSSCKSNAQSWSQRSPRERVHLLP